MRFLTSAAEISQCPLDVGSEIAFVGRSNAGKSSALNTITRNHRLARTSKTPGRTQTLNFFELDEKHRLVDLPGYGYAKVPVNIKLKWEKVLTQYVEERQSLKGIILIMDIRHPLKPFDWQMIEWASAYHLPIHILLTKSDKLKRGAANNTLLDVRKKLSGYEPLVTAQLFSAFSSQGVEEAHLKMNDWFAMESNSLEFGAGE